MTLISKVLRVHTRKHTKQRDPCEPKVHVKIGLACARTSKRPRGDRLRFHSVAQRCNDGCDLVNVNWRLFTLGPFKTYYSLLSLYKAD